MFCSKCGTRQGLCHFRIHNVVKIGKKENRTTILRIREDYGEKLIILHTG